ncbi:MAG: Na+/H+ antiporter subunit E [Paracoccaceae bacterium]
MIARILPHPILTFALVLLWMILNSFSIGHLILGAMVGLGAGKAMAALHPARPRIRRLDLLIRLFFIVGGDIIRSNIAVATLILSGGRHGRRRSGFVEIRLDLHDETALAALAVIVTATPGTAWLDYRPATGVLLLHVFDLIDEEQWRQTIKGRYESLLMEIFQ